MNRGGITRQGTQTCALNMTRFAYVTLTMFYPKNAMEKIICSRIRYVALIHRKERFICPKMFYFSRGEECIGFLSEYTRKHQFIGTENVFHM